MKCPILVCALWAVATAMLAAQTPQSNPYSGTSNPPPDDTITDSMPPAPAAKPPATHYAQPAAPEQPAHRAAPTTSASVATPGSDDGIVQVAPSPRLNQRSADVTDPDGDIVHPAPLPPGVLGEGTEIRVRLLDRLSTAESQPGQPFRASVASDVFRGNDVLIPAGSEIDGRVVDVSAGDHLGGHGSMLLRPDTLILPDGARYRLYAQLTGTPGSATRIGSEGAISPDSRVKKGSIEYGGAMGAGAVTGAVLAGPAGALAGTLIGAGAITAHLLVDHPQATLESGTALMFSLTEPLNLSLSPEHAAPAAHQAAPEGLPPADTQANTDTSAAAGTLSQN